MRDAFQDTYSNQDDLILGSYKTFSAAGVNIWDCFDCSISNGKSDGIMDIDTPDCHKSKDKLYVYAAEYHRPSLSKSLKDSSEIAASGRLDDECRSMVSEHKNDHNMNDALIFSDDSACTETVLELSKNGSILSVSENTCSDVAQRCDFEESNNYAENSNSSENHYTEESNTNISAYDSTQTRRTSWPRMYSKIKIMLVNDTKRRNVQILSKLTDFTIDHTKASKLKRVKMEKKNKTSQVPEDQLKLKKMRHKFTRECEICGFLPAFIPKCKFHNEEKFLFHKRKVMALADNPETIAKIDQLLPKSYQLISSNYSNSAPNITPSLTTQWYIKTDESEETEESEETKKNPDLIPISRFFKDFSMILSQG